MKLEGLRRIDVPEIDKAAFREAIINAFCHRDYREFDSVNIAVFKDRVEIRSPGLLYGGLTLETIRTKMVSERRNELIAEMLHRVHFIEKWGRGIKLILSKEPDTKFSEVGTKFITTFRRRSYFEGKKGFEKLGEKGKESKEKSKEKILRLMIENSAITIQEIAEILGMSLAGVEKTIRILKQQEHLRRIGPDKGGYWEVVKK
ncbi:MAG: winged helix-turn-helix transcriptional regulator [Planctomycetes bacterium]|uniref:ATP-binding protein n=1 Tax=Candidatus Wunengus californicus TaxID=3367619 RepID=UPI0040256C64|nr:winged helix-turn-helix transcriptional regulator [Planctomycetota bacterium]